MTTPATVGITQIGVSANIAEVLISIGNTLVSVGDPRGPDNTCTIQPYVQWLQTISMSPQMAAQLCERLGHALMEYQQQFGAIPRDPRFKIEPGKTLQ